MREEKRTGYVRAASTLITRFKWTTVVDKQSRNVRGAASI